jgi:Cu/Ag efflux protein CusF
MLHSIKLVLLMASAAFAMSAAVLAQTAGPAPRGRPASSPAAAQGPLADGEVLEVDKAGKRVLVKHGPIQHIGMDAMTMEFGVPDEKLLSSLKPGDKVRFAAIWKDGDYVITRVEVVRRPKAKRP